jgi:uncharacterized damage-inducible protein DinB
MLVEQQTSIGRMEDIMTISEALLPEFDQEIANTRKTLERVPSKPEFAPHPKSMPLGSLAPHVAQLVEFGLTVLTTPQFEFSAGSYSPLQFESAAQLAKVLDDGAAKVRQALVDTPDEAWSQPWKLVFDGTVLFDGSRFLAYRQMFLNHVVHHRAQLGVYLRLNGVAVPAIYGPSADEQ